MNELKEAKKIADLPDDVKNVKSLVGKHIEWQYETFIPRHYSYMRGYVLSVNGLDLVIDTGIGLATRTTIFNYLKMIDVTILRDDQLSPATKENADLAVFEGIEAGNRFFSTNDKTITEKELCTTDDGQVSYKILGYAHTSPEAQTILYGSCFPHLKSRPHLQARI